MHIYVFIVEAENRTRVHVHIYQIILLRTHNVQCSTVEPRLSESPLSEPSVIRTLCLILKSQKQFDFLQNQVINEMSA